jgi:hypothetical protein
VDQFSQWRAVLTEARKAYVSQGADWQIEVEFVDALIAILDDQTHALKSDHPYYSHVGRVIDALKPDAS